MKDEFDNDGLIGPSPKWYVMFSGLAPDEQRTKIVDWFQPRHCTHVSAFFYDPRGERWVVYDVNRGGIAINALPSDLFDQFILAMKRFRSARVFEVDWRPIIRPPLQLGMWCVVAVRYAIGSKSLAWRPIGLMRDLQKEGAREVFA